MDALGIADGATVADLGAGGGLVHDPAGAPGGPNGIVYAEDVQPEMIEAITRRVEREGLTNVKPVLGAPTNPRLPETALDAVLIVSVYNEMEILCAPQERCGRPEAAWTPRHRRLHTEGFGPGPPMEERVKPERIVTEAQAAGLKLIAQEGFLRYRALLVFAR